MPPARYIKQYTVRRAVTEACYLFRDLQLELLLRRDLDWRAVRRRVLGTQIFGTRWRGRANGKAMRLTREGLEFREGGEIRSYTWLDMQQIVHADRTYDR
jgi:hypothetical protein